MAGKISRRAFVAAGTGIALPASRAQPAPSASVWIDEPRRSVDVANRYYTGIGAAQEPFDVAEARTLEQALARADIGVGAAFRQAVDTAAPTSESLDGVRAAADGRSAQIEISPHVALWAMKGARARLEMMTKVSANIPGVRSFDLTCRTFTSLVLPNEGEGSWTDAGFRTLRASVARCARDLLLLVQTELGMRRRGVWKSPVEAERLHLIEFRMYTGWEPVRNEVFIVRETDTVLACAVAHGRGLGHLRDIRYIVDKPLVTSRGPV